MANRSTSFHWQSLFRVVSRRAYELMEAHNLQYPTEAECRRYEKVVPGIRERSVFSIAYPRRIKESEEKTILNVLKQWCKQVAKQIQSGEKVITNLVYTNRRSSRNFKRSARGSNAHFAKGVYCGCLVGEVDEITAEYKCQFTYADGRGVGVRPWKRFHGTRKDFELCIHPDLIPVNALPEDVEPEVIDPYEDEPEKRFHAKAWELAFQDPSKGQKMPPFPEGIETLNKEISRPEVPADGNSKEVASFSKLYLNGQVLEAYATLLMGSYEQKLAKAMGRNFSHAELARGQQAARNMLKACSQNALEGFVDRCLRTIAHMEQWIQHDPARNFVMPPSKWFDLDSASNIAGAYRKFLQPWELTARQWVHESPPEKAPDHSRNSPDEYQVLALMLKKHLTHLHPNDQRIQASNPAKWALDIQRLQKDSKLSLSEIRKTILWLFKNPSQRAQFWRKESGGFGIRSASGLRRNFQQIYTQMTYEQSFNKYETATSRNQPQAIRQTLAQIQARVSTNPQRRSHPQEPLP